MRVPDGHILRKVPVLSGVVGLVALALSVALSASDWAAFFRAYHVAFVFFVSLALGGMFFTLLRGCLTARRALMTRPKDLPQFVIVFGVTIWLIILVNKIDLQSLRCPRLFPC